MIDCSGSKRLWPLARIRQDVVHGEGRVEDGLGSAGQRPVKATAAKTDQIQNCCHNGQTLTHTVTGKVGFVDAETFAPGWLFSHLT